MLHRRRITGQNIKRERERERVRERERERERFPDTGLVTSQSGTAYRSSGAPEFSPGL